MKYIKRLMLIVSLFALLLMLVVLPAFASEADTVQIVYGESSWEYDKSGCETWAELVEASPFFETGLLVDDSGYVVFQWIYDDPFRVCDLSGNFVKSTDSISDSVYTFSDLMLILGRDEVYFERYCFGGCLFDITDTVEDDELYIYEDDSGNIWIKLNGAGPYEVYTPELARVNVNDTISYNYYLLGWECTFSIVPYDPVVGACDPVSYTGMLYGTSVWSAIFTECVFTGDDGSSGWFADYSEEADDFVVFRIDEDGDGNWDVQYYLVVPDGTETIIL